MRLSKNLPQFKNKPTLIVVSAWQSGRVFYALDGEIAEIDKLVVPDHKYSDKEGFFATRVRNGISTSGSVLEKKKYHIRNEFLSQFIKRVGKLSDEFNIKDIYLFTPSRGVNDLNKKFSASMRKMVRGCYLGNYIKHGPSRLVEIIKKKRPKPVEIISEEARKILDMDH